MPTRLLSTNLLKCAVIAAGILDWGAARGTGGEDDPCVDPAGAPHLSEPAGLAATETPMPEPIGAEMADPASQDSQPLPFNIPMPTLGGRQLWGDILHFRGWRIQQNVLTQHYRLLDPGDVRQAWGTIDDCRRALKTIREQQGLQPMSGRAVILVHGIIRSSKSFAALQSRLTGEGYVVVPFDYPSTRLPIAESARYLRQVIESLEGIEQIDLVVHSMGGLLVRAYLQQTASAPDLRIRRMVMLGVPNMGAKLANIAQKNVLFKSIFGPAGQQLIEDPEGVISKLPTPAFEFGVLAGSRGQPEGYNPLIPGDDDGVVSVSATRLPGARDYIQVIGWHSFLMSNTDCIEAAVRFLKTGAFRESGEREPIMVDTSETNVSPADTDPAAAANH
ncbi:MAG: alpha/beta fold hydrolase [Planctomycetaceae bacterium]